MFQVSPFIRFPYTRLFVLGYLRTFAALLVTVSTRIIDLGSAADAVTISILHMTHTTKSNAIIFFLAFNLLFILLFFYLFRVATPNKDSQYFVLIIHISCNFYIYVRIISYRKRICSILGNFNFLVKRSILTFQIMESPILIYQAKIHIC